MVSALTQLKDGLHPQGLVEVFVTTGAPKVVLLDRIENQWNMPLCRDHRIDFTGCTLLSSEKSKNIIVNTGKDAIINSLSTGNILKLYRMCIGDRGTIPSDSQVPKVPVATMTGLFNEVYRADAEAVVLNTGTPSVHEIKLVKTFSASQIPITAFSNQAKPVVNEVGLVLIDIAQGAPPRDPVAAPNPVPADELLFAFRTYKSVPFDAANDISVTIRYTIYIE